MIVYCVAGGEEEAARIARALVEEKLAACVNRFPCRSIFRWEGKVEEAEEVVLICKTRKDNYEALERRVKELHSYEVPTIVAFPLTRGEKKYLSWVKEETSR